MNIQLQTIQAALTWGNTKQFLNGLESGWTMGHLRDLEVSVRAGGNSYLAFGIQNAQIQYALVQLSRSFEAVGKKALPWWVYTLAWCVPAGIAYGHSRAFENATLRRTFSWLHDKMGTTAQAIHVIASVNIYRSGQQVMGATSIASFAIRATDKYFLPHWVREKIHRSNFAVLNTIRLFVGDSKSQKFASLIEVSFMVANKVLTRLAGNDTLSEFTKFLSYDELQGTAVTRDEVNQRLDPNSGSLSLFDQVLQQSRRSIPIEVNEPHLMTDSTPHTLPQEDLQLFLDLAEQIDWKQHEKTLESKLLLDPRWQKREKFETADPTAENRAGLVTQLKHGVYLVQEQVLKILIKACQLIRWQRMASMLMDYQLTGFVPKTQVEYMQRGLRILVHRLKNRQIMAGEPRDYEALLKLCRQVAGILKQVNENAEMSAQEKQVRIADTLMSLGVEGEYCGPGVFDVAEQIVKDFTRWESSNMKTKVLGILERDRYMKFQGLWRFIWSEVPVYDKLGQLVDFQDRHLFNQFVNLYGHLVGIKSESAQNDGAALVSPLAKWLITKAAKRALEQAGGVKLYQIFLARPDDPSQSYSSKNIVMLIRESIAEGEIKPLAITEWFHNWFQERHPQATDDDAVDWVSYELAEMVPHPHVPGRQVWMPKEKYIEAMLLELGVFKWKEVEASNSQ